MRFYWLRDQCRQKKPYSLETRKTQYFRLSIKNLTPQHITFQFDLPMYSIPSKKRQKLYLNYQQYYKGVFKQNFHQLLSNHWIKSIQWHQWPLCQYRTNNVRLHNTFLPLQNRPSKPVSLNHRRHSNVVLSKTNKYTVRRKSTFQIVSHKYNQHSNIILYVRLYLGFNIMYLSDC